jgi:arylsulfatase A-like enzyme
VIGRWLFLMMVALVAAGCGRNTSDAPQASAPPLGANVVFIVIDTLRADHLAAYGYSRDTAPFVGELAKQGVVFEKALAPSSWTVPATASLFTSVYPDQHGVTLGDRYYRPGRVEPMPVVLNRIPKGLETMPEMFRRRGYRTFAVSDNYFVSEKGGFARGFDRFMNFNDRGAQNVTDAALRWKDDLVAPGAPYFLYIHYLDPHWPYAVRRPWYEEDGVRSPTVCAYDSEISFADSQLRRLFDECGQFGDALVIVTSDHGEEFGDHGDEGHRFKLYQELLHVPLIVRFPGAQHAAQRIAAPVSLVDLLPTLREWAGDSASKQDVGISLLPLAKGGAPADRFLFAMRTKEADVLLAEKKAVMQGDRKLIVNLPEGKEEFYDLAVDPREQRSVVESRAEDAEALRAALAAFEKSAKTWPREYVNLGAIDTDLREKLRSLGYVH